MKTFRKMAIIFLLVLSVTLAGCSNYSSTAYDSQAGISSNAVLSGITQDKIFSITVTTINVTTSTNTNTGTVTEVSGTFELTNLTDSPIPTASVYFGVLDKESNSPYWGSVQINTLDKIDPKANVQGSFTVQLPAGVDVKNCDLIFGPLPKITFEAPIPIEK